MSIYPNSATDAGLPMIIQGGMGVGVSNWQLARAVSMAGQLGVVSGTAIDTMLVRRLQDGDPDGHVRRAMAQFPIPAAVEDTLDRYFLAGGRPEGTPYVTLPMYKQNMSVRRQQLTMLANFVEVYLAKEGHGGVVGINLLTKIQMPNLASLYGAMLANVDYVFMGAGIPGEMPGALDAFAEHRPATVRFDVEGTAPGEIEQLTFDPALHWTTLPAPIRRPMFVPIVSANSLATTLARKANGRVDGFIVEGPTAGGHNAPPRGQMKLNEAGEPIYGERDVVDLAKLSELGLPFWVAGGAGSPEGLQQALAAGAAGIQVGTLFAYADESGITAPLKEQVLTALARDEVHIITDPRASPTGYPFKLVDVDGIESQDDDRERVCDLGYLRSAYRTASGGVGYRCAAEPVETYVAKGGDIADTVGRRCLCNGLVADVGHPQLRRDGRIELPLLTSGDTLLTMREFVNGRTRYRAADVVDYLLSSAAARQRPEALEVGNP
jgi:NAD(P)H-dependent flavin oxidoreductase YrpB (nitropropane dioxygenase family)